jgi:hypothetical protein
VAVNIIQDQSILSIHVAPGSINGDHIARVILPEIKVIIGFVWSMVIVLLITVEGELEFHATSCTVHERIFILITPFPVAKTVTSNFVRSKGETCTILLQVDEPTNEPDKIISAQVKLPVFKASDAETKNFTRCHDVSKLCHVARLIDKLGLIKSNTQVDQV